MCHNKALSYWPVYKQVTPERWTTLYNIRTLNTLSQEPEHPENRVSIYIPGVISICPWTGDFWKLNFGSSIPKVANAWIISWSWNRVATSLWDVKTPRDASRMICSKTVVEKLVKITSWKRHIFLVKDI